jgi:hypothetical protein
MSPYCTYCGNELEASWNVCPKCGKVLNEPEVPQAQQQPQQAQYHPLYQPQQPQTQQYQQAPAPSKGYNYGTIALICGIIGIPTGFFYFGPVLGVIAIIMGGMGLTKDDNPAIAVIGLILGVVDLIFFFFFFWAFSWLNWFWPW